MLCNEVEVIKLYSESFRKKVFGALDTFVGQLVLLMINDSGAVVFVTICIEK